MLNLSTKKGSMMRYFRLFGLSLFILGLLLFSSSAFLTRHEWRAALLAEVIKDSTERAAAAPQLASLEGQQYSNAFAFGAAAKERLTAAGLPDYRVGEYTTAAAKKSVTGFVLGLSAAALWLLSLLLGAGGALIYILSQWSSSGGIRNDGIYHSSATRRGWIGIAVGTYLIGFYVLLYFFPQYIVGWTLLLDPVSRALSGNEASHWFVYGVLYCLCMLVMGARMVMRYRHNRYQLIRTASVVFFQLGFAFLLPEIMVSLNQPYMDLKNAFPLNYSMFYDYNISGMVSQGADLGFARLGTLMFIWGIILSVLVVPLMTYLYGKRWYCSWVCGCGGLAETLGDPYRQLSDKSIGAWRVERYMIYSVLVLVLLMTAAVLYTYFTGAETVLFVKSATLRSWYGFAIGSVFAGVVGTGFYPLMGNRVWCRFGCPLAALMGIVQRFKSRFRITTNGGQCISCGNCSTYCEMGIDVRAYAQKGQDIVRASCVGCGICSAVCPRGVLRLENASEDVGVRADTERVLRIHADRIEFLG
jgi:ferredoxin-type protein NapH